MKGRTVAQSKGYCAAVGYAGTSTNPTYQNYMTADMSKGINLSGLSGAQPHLFLQDSLN